MMKHHLLLWTPRLLGIAIGVFFSLFAFDALQTGRPLARVWAEIAINLAPAAIVLAIVALAWRRPWTGAVSFIVLAAGYALFARSRPDWMVAISGPLIALGILFLLSWRQSRGLRSAGLRAEPEVGPSKGGHYRV